MAALGQSLPSTSRGCSCATPLVVQRTARPHACAPVSAAAPPQRLQLYKRFCISLFKLSSRLNQSPPAASPRAAPAVPAARPQPPVLPVPCGADRRPAGDRQACGAGCAGRPQHGVGAVVSGTGRLIFLRSYWLPVYYVLALRELLS